MYTDRNPSIPSESATTARNLKPHDESAGPDPLRSDEPAPAWPSAIFDEIDYGMLVLDARRKVILANRTAIAQLDETGELILKNDELIATHARDVRELGTAIREAADHHRRGFVMIGRPGRRRALAIIPLPQGRATGEAYVLILLARPRICEPLSVLGFSRAHELTAAESRVLLGLCEGHLPAEIAADNNVAISTVRTQITRLRQKTDAASIGEIVLCVARLPPIRVLL